MFQFNGEKGKKAKMIMAIVVIVIVAAMILGAVIGGLAGAR